MNEKEIRYFSLFSGIGGFELGIEQASSRPRLERPIRNSVWNGGRKPHTLRKGNGQDGRQRTHCVGFSEIDKHATQIYQRHFPDHKAYGDITNIDTDALPDFDLLCGGFPCQAFSMAGKRLGFNDTRGTLFFEIARLARAKRPRLLFLENVKGLLSHDGGNTFQIIIFTLDELGYDLQWQVLNSKNHGVPQNRERVFIVGHLRGTPRPQIFPLGADDRQDPSLHQDEAQVAQTLVTGYARNQSDGQYVDETFVQSIPHGYNKGWKKQLPNLRAHGGAVHNEVLMPQLRRLTPVECERLQGFPDGWTEGVSDTQRYKCLGNAVTVNVIENIATRLLA